MVRVLTCPVRPNISLAIIFSVPVTFHPVPSTAPVLHAGGVCGLPGSQPGQQASAPPPHNPKPYMYSIHPAESLLLNPVPAHGLSALGLFQLNFRPSPGTRSR